MDRHIDHWRHWLQPTLANALQTEFYQRHWAGLDVSQIGAGDLSRLPIVRKEELREAGDLARLRECGACVETFTMGTTGAPFCTVRGKPELTFIRQHFRTEIRGARPTLRRRVARFVDPYHGYRIKVPSNVHCHDIGHWDAGSFGHAIELLQARFHDAGIEDRISTVIGLEPFLRCLTEWAQNSMPLSAIPSVESIVCYGEMLLPRWRRAFENAWRCDVIDRFSLSEVFGGATGCSCCGWFHFDPFVIPEVLCCDKMRPVKEGVGILTLTALFPFQQAQPMVRYWTGDLVKVTATQSCMPGQLAIVPLGRAPYGVPGNGPSSEWLLSPKSILEALDGVVGLTREARFSDASQVLDNEAIGNPLYSVSHSSTNGKVTVDLTLNSKQRDVESASFGRTVVERLCASSERFAQAVQAREVCLRITAGIPLHPASLSFST